MLRRAAAAAVDILYPTRCLGCGRFGTLLCPTCTAGMELATGTGRCSHCRALWDQDSNCPRCFNLQALTGVVAVCEMAGVARRAVHALKYQFVRDVAPVMGAHLREASNTHVFDAVFPVPLHRTREKARGFNQARLLVEAAGWSTEPGLSRVRRTDQQVGMHERQRRANVAGAFRYTGRDLSMLCVALVDDVITTGSTMQECATALRAAGAREVWGVGFARASYRLGAGDAPLED